MSEPLIVCPSCDLLFVPGAPLCPHCHASVSGRRASRSATALLLGLGATLGVATACVVGDVVGEPAPVDDDADGFFDYEDCDDGDAAVYPGADEVVGDEIDSNCDGEDDT